MRDKQREETRRRLYQAALEIFRRDGVAHCRIDDIAKRAEVSRAAFYFHFPTKEDVLFEFLRESEAPVTEQLHAQSPTQPLEETLTLCARLMADYWRHHPELLPEVMAATLRHGSHVVDRESNTVRSAMTTRFKAAAERGELSGALPPEVLSDFFLMNCLVAMVGWVGARHLDLEVVLQGVVALFLEGARGRP